MAKAVLPRPISEVQYRHNLLWLMKCICFCGVGDNNTDSPEGARGGSEEENRMQDDIDDNGAQVVSLECVVWENVEGLNKRAEWTVLVGDSSGRVHLIDITDVSFQKDL